jgi:hypothetical protein
MNESRLMKTPLWDIEPFPTLLFDPDVERARKLAAALRKEGLPVEVAPTPLRMDRQTVLAHA